jgi:NAD(P)-dependent dehydrogenase (short-subunit alcohol dehydrogenase family)
MELRDRQALVTGAGQGLGRATAIALADAGCRAVVVADIDGDAATDTVAEIDQRGARGLVAETDLARREEIEGLFHFVEEELGGLDILVNNAAIAEGETDWPEVSMDRLGEIVDVNLRGTIYCTRLALPLMRAGGGAICNVASGGAFAPSLPQAAYVATKAGIVHFSRSCEGLLQTHGVRVTCLCPGMIDTPGLHAIGGAPGPPPWLAESFRQWVPLAPADVAAKILEMISDDSSELLQMINGAPRATSST